MSKYRGRPRSAPPMVSIRALRRAKGMSLARLAAEVTALGYPVSASQLNNVELGHRGASTELLAAWAQALDLHDDDIDAAPTRRAPQRRTA